MADEVKAAATLNTADAPKDTLLANANADGKDVTILDEAGDEAKAEEQRLIETDDVDLSPEELEQKTTLVKAQSDAKIAEAAKAKAIGIPEKYEFTAPEGMTVDQALVEKVTPIFKELQLSNVQAQKLAAVYAEQLKASQTEQKVAFDKFKEESKNETIKALGATYKQELAYAAKARDRFLSPETVEILNATGMANNISLIKDLIKIGRLVSEEKFVDGKRVIPVTERSAADVMYPDQAKR